MSKTALSNKTLLSVEKPARYIGREVNSVIKDKAHVDIRYAMCFPDVYEIGMSHLGIQIIYDQLNRRDDIWCERVYSPWPDLHNILMSTGQKLFALESQDPISEFDFLGITIQYELCYTNILQVLELSGIPLHAKDRKDGPIVMGGGPCTSNPEPLADFFDLFYIGESETVMYDLMDLYKEHKKSGMQREEFLHQAAKIEGIYVPSLYDVTYNEDMTVKEYVPKYDDIPKKIIRQVIGDLTNTFYPTKPVIPYIRAVQDKVTLEIMRGCIRGCRFCQAGMYYRPTRYRSLDFLKERAITLLENTGYDELSLSSLSSSDYPHLRELLEFLIEKTEGMHVNLALPSLRIDRFSLDVMKRVQDIKKSSLTFAPEAGSQRLRDVINKGLTKENIINGSSQAFKGGWSQVKLYFMLGQPFENDEDRKAIAHIAQAIADEYYAIPKEERKGKLKITVSTSFFVAKPFTPFQWASMFHKEDYEGYARIVRSEIKDQKNSAAIKYNWHESDVTVIEGVLARGDRRLSSVIEEVYRDGGIFDAWTDYFDNDRWLRAFEKCSIDPDFYTTRVRDKDEVFPWDIIDAGVTKEFLYREWERASKETLTPNCEERCNACGAKMYGCGICMDK